MGKKSNKIIKNEIENEENENEVGIKLLNSKILSQQKINNVIYVNNFLKNAGIITLSC
jgi:hypothetical protein